MLTLHSGFISLAISRHEHWDVMAIANYYLKKIKRQLHNATCHHVLLCSNKGICKGRVVPLQARYDPEGTRRFRLPDFHDIRHMKVVRSLASRTGPLYPQECYWYSFSLGAESTPGPWCGWKEISLKNPVTPPEIDPGTVRLVAQRLNHYATPGPYFIPVGNEN